MSHMQRELLINRGSRDEVVEQLLDFGYFLLKLLSENRLLVLKSRLVESDTLLRKRLLHTLDDGPTSIPSFVVLLSPGADGRHPTLHVLISAELVSHPPQVSHVWLHGVPHLIRHESVALQFRAIGNRRNWLMGVVI